MKWGLSEKHIASIKKIISQNESIDEAILYGSRAMGTFKKGSDIDITFKGTHLNLEQLNKTANDLDDLLLPYEFDLSIFDDISDPSFLDHISRVGQVFYQKGPKS